MSTVVAELLTSHVAKSVTSCFFVVYSAVQAKSRYPNLSFQVLDVLENPAEVKTLGQGCSVVFVDIGGNRHLEALVRLLPWIEVELRPRLMVVKSEEVAAAAEGWLRRCDRATSIIEVEQEQQQEEKVKQQLQRQQQQLKPQWQQEVHHQECEEDQSLKQEPDAKGQQQQQGQQGHHEEQKQEEKKVQQQRLEQELDAEAHQQQGQQGHHEEQQQEEKKVQQQQQQELNAEAHQQQQGQKWHHKQKQQQQQEQQPVAGDATSCGVCCGSSQGLGSAQDLHGCLQGLAMGQDSSAAGCSGNSSSSTSVHNSSSTSSGFVAGVQGSYISEGLLPQAQDFWVELVSLSGQQQDQQEGEPAGSKPQAPLTAAEPWYLKEKGAGFRRNPLRYPQRHTAVGQRICRPYNYSVCFKGGECPFDHGHCHHCGAEGHRGADCSVT